MSSIAIFANIPARGEQVDVRSTTAVIIGSIEYKSLFGGQSWSCLRNFGGDAVIDQSVPLHRHFASNGHRRQACMGLRPRKQHLKPVLEKKIDDEVCKFGIVKRNKH